MNTVLKLIFIIPLLFTCIVVNGQEYNIYDYSTPQEFEIGNIEVEGAVDRDRNAIKSIAGLKVGKKINIPGDHIPKAIKSLWRLRLFEDVRVEHDSIVGDKIFLKIFLKERPTLSQYAYRGIKKTHHDNLNDDLENILNKGSIVTDDVKSLATMKIKDYFIEKGFLDTRVSIQEVQDEKKENNVKLIFIIDKGERVKIDNIDFVGAKVFKQKKLRKRLKKTKRKKNIFKKSRLIREEFKNDKKSLIAYYNKNGYRDATIISEDIKRNDEGNIDMTFVIDEGQQYYFGDINWKGNSKYTSDQLTAILGIQKGEVFNPELLEKRLQFSLDGRDISSLYLDDGYLFFNVDPQETAVINDTINMTMVIYEGAQATIDIVGISGNDRTHEHVIRRELRTRPGNKFSRSDIIRSQREISNLGYFNPESIDIQTPVNQERGTVDILYDLEERPSDQLELSAGYGGAQGLIGTLGVTFNNFSIRNIRDKSTWNPLPQGDGQRFSLRGQSSGRFFKSLNASFTEPWLGGKKPNALTVGASTSILDQSTLDQGKLTITRLYAGLGTQLKWPDDFFSFNATLNLEFINLNNFQSGGFTVFENNSPVSVTAGTFQNFYIQTTIQRSSINQPLYPRNGSRVSLNLQFTPPYSLFRTDNFWPLSDDEQAAEFSAFFEDCGNACVPPSNLIQSAELSKKFEWLEYHKWRLDFEWYYNIVDKFVIATKAKMGFLGYYNENIGIPPFERYEFGGDGLSNQTFQITGKDIIAQRGYDVADYAVNNQGGANIFNKFTVELRYPLSLNPSSTIYALAFLEGGNAWNGFKNYNPFELQRAVGGGLRVFLPMFGLLGFDYGIGFDKRRDNPASTQSYGKFSIILGFEPD